MNTLTVTGAGALDGVYEFDDFDQFTNRELHRIKKLTGLRAGEFDDAFQAGDSDLLVALAVVVIERDGKKVVDDVLWDAPAGALEFQFGEQEDPTPAEVPSPASVFGEKTNGSQSSSGISSDERSGPRESDPSPTGIPV